MRAREAWIRSSSGCATSRDPRGVEVLRRLAKLIGWQPRPSPAARAAAATRAGRGIAYIHYKHNETYVAIGMEVEVERATA